MHNRVRLTPEQRKRLILNAAVKVADDIGVFNFSITNVSRHLSGTSKATIKHYYTMDQLRTAVINEALKRPDCVRIVAQAVAMEHKAVNHLDEQLKQAYLKHV